MEWLTLFGIWIAIITVGVMFIPSFINWAHKHSIELCKDLEIMVVSTVEFSQRKYDLNLYVKPDLRDCSKMVKAHLDNIKYKNIKLLIERRNFYIDKLHNAELQKYSEQLILNILSIIEQRIPIEWNNTRPPESKKYFVRKNIQDDLIEAIRNNYRTHKSILLVIYGDQLTCNGGSVWIKSDDSKELEEIKELVERKFTIIIKNNTSILLKAYFEEIMNLHNLIKDEILDIIYNIKSGGFIKGHCELNICKNFLRYL